jgi:uncharacterized membrane protein
LSHAHLDAYEPVSKRKTDARTNAPPETGGSGWTRNRIARRLRQGRRLTPRLVAGVGASVQEKRIHQIFVVSVLFKGAHAVIEIVGGLALYLTSTATILGWINRFSQGELTEDPNDWVANKVLEFGRNFSVEQQHFYAFYLLSHGVVKLILVYGLLKEKLWAYPASFVVFTAFIAYQR